MGSRESKYEEGFEERLLSKRVVAFGEHLEGKTFLFKGLGNDHKSLSNVKAQSTTKQVFKT